MIEHRPSHPEAHAPCCRRGHHSMDWLMAVLVFGGVLGLLGASLVWTAWQAKREDARAGELHGS